MFSQKPNVAQRKILTSVKEEPGHKRSIFCLFAEKQKGKKIRGPKLLTDSQSNQRSKLNWNQKKTVRNLVGLNRSENDEKYRASIFCFHILLLLGNQTDRSLPKSQNEVQKET